MHALSYRIPFGGSFEEHWTDDYALTVSYSGCSYVEARNENGIWVAVAGDDNLVKLINSEMCPPLTRQYFRAAASIRAALDDCASRGFEPRMLNECFREAYNPAAAPELLRALLDDCGLSLESAFDAVAACCDDCRGSGLNPSDLAILQPRTAAVLKLLRSCAAERVTVRCDSADSAYRFPTGAVRQGEKVTLSLEVLSGRPVSAELLLSGCEINQTYHMERLGGRYSVSISAPEKEGLYEYCFRIRTREVTFFVCPDEGEHRGCVYDSACPGFRLTVYKADFDTPEWFRQSVMYQIFPDRFALSPDGTASEGISYHRSLGQTPELHESVSEDVRYKPRDFETAYSPDDFYGGTFKGIESRLPYLKNLGVGCIYLNPISEARSNHRYDTSDYLKPDPVLGTAEDFESLCKAACEAGIRIILDGVFSHTGADSVYFNRFGSYPGPGACDGEKSPYYPWYSFKSFPDDYKCWWGFKDLPEVDEHDPQWQNFIISGENSVVKTWLRRGASGWRLDVADELPDDVLCLIRKAVKSEKEDAPIIGEVWENAVTKESYGEKRQYALGGALDSVMNYPFRTAVLGFLKGDIDACGLRDFLISQQSDYPPPLYGALMNLLGSHDVERLLTALGTDSDIKKMNRDEQLELELTADMEKKAVQLEKLAAAIQFTVPGVPCVYYGDEQGMQGGRDPFNRRFFQKHNIELYKYYVNLSKLRNTSDVLKCGDMKVRAINTDMIEIVRYVNKTALTLTIDRAVPSVRFSPEAGISELLNF